MSALSAWVVRPVGPADRESLHELAVALGPGMTTLPADIRTLGDKIDASLASFAGRASGGDAQYLMVLEDVDSGTILGTAAVYPCVGHPFGFFSYKRSHLVQHSKEFKQSVEFDLLSLVNDFTGATEIGTLAVRPSLRGGGAGRLLARSRYMLMACFPAMFASRVMAEMRGWQDNEGRSPFWEAVGSRFFKMSFAEADRLSAVHGAEFIADLLPKHPIYPDLLSPEARAVIGVPHRASAPALAMLRAEGFRYEGLVDIFDAGPQVSVERDQIATVARSVMVEIDGPDPSLAEGPALVATTTLEAFRVASVPVAAGILDLDAATRNRLLIGSGEFVRVSPNLPNARGTLSHSFSSDRQILLETV